MKLHKTNNKDHDQDQDQTQNKCQNQNRTSVQYQNLDQGQDQGQEKDLIQHCDYEKFQKNKHTIEFEKSHTSFSGWIIKLPRSKS